MCVCVGGELKPALSDPRVHALSITTAQCHSSNTAACLSLMVTVAVEEPLWLIRAHHDTMSLAL